MFQLDLKSHRSIYQQVIDNIKELIISGILNEDDKLPSVRELSKSLTINPNTVQKAFKELEREGFLYKVPGKGTFVKAREDEQIDQKLVDEICLKIEAAYKELRYAGLSKDQAQNILEKRISAAEEDFGTIQS